MSYKFLYDWILYILHDYTLPRVISKRVSKFLAFYLPINCMKESQKVVISRFQTSTKFSSEFLNQICHLVHMGIQCRSDFFHFFFKIWFFFFSLQKLCNEELLISNVKFKIEVQKELFHSISKVFSQALRDFLFWTQRRITVNYFNLVPEV